MNGHKAEAQKALQTVIEALAGPEPIEGLKRFQVKAAAEYAASELAAVVETKRQRKEVAPA